MKNIQKKHIKFYFGISIFINFVSSFITMMQTYSNIHGGGFEALFEIFVFCTIICSAVYSIYFTIPEFNKNWEKIAGLVLPSLVLSLVLLVEETFIYVVFVNLILNLLFIWHFTNTSKKNN